MTCLFFCKCDKDKIIDAYVIVDLWFIYWGNRVLAILTHDDRFLKVSGTSSKLSDGDEVPSCI